MDTLVQMPVPVTLKLFCPFLLNLIYAIMADNRLEAIIKFPHESVLHLTLLFKN
jgi:hypothetical protein